MQGRFAQKGDVKKPTKTIRLWRIHRELLEGGRVPSTEKTPSGRGTARDGANATGGTIKERTT